MSAVNSKFERLRKKYSAPAATFHYIFAHDHEKDIRGFVKEYKLPEVIVANQSVLQSFHSPQLPSIYVSDRDGWFLTRYLKATDENLEQLEQKVLQYLFLLPKP